MRRNGMCVGVLALTVLSVVGGSVGASAPPGSGPGGGVVGDAVAIAARVEWRAGAGGSYAPVATAQPVAVGDGVRTDATGFAEVAYGDGSRTRLDVNTEFDVVALVDDAGNAVTRTQMGVGRTWHRVQAVGAASGGFEVETSQATATVRGTAFLVSCLTVESCDYSVMEGVVDVALADGTVVTVTAPATLDVTNGVATGPTPLTWDALFGDPWLVTNTDLDAQAGFADRAAVYSAYGPGYGSLAGTYAGTRTIVSVECVTVCLPNDVVVGDVAEREYTLAVDCAGGVPCAGTAVVQYAHDTEVLSATVPVNVDGGQVRWTLTYTREACVFDDGTPSGSQTSDLAWVLTPAAAEVRDGIWMVTSLTGEAASTDTINDLGLCDPPGYAGRTARSTVDVSR